MKVATSKEMAHLESLSYERGFKEDEFMHRAGVGVADLAVKFSAEWRTVKQILILAGRGNNAGDAYVAGKVLLQKGFKVSAWLDRNAKESPLCQKNRESFTSAGGQLIDARVCKEPDFDEGIIIDAIFGTGLNRAPEEPYASMIAWANRSRCPILSVDIPSGLSGDTGEVFGEAVRAKATAALGLAKLGFFLKRGWDHVGEIHLVDFGLPKDVTDSFVTPFTLYEREKSLEALPFVRRGRHKYEAGAVFGFAGSPGMPGAAILASLASLRTGAGIVRLYHPQEMATELAASPYELIKVAYSENPLEVLEAGLKRADSAFIGPGIGRSQKTGEIIQYLMGIINCPAVIDADALYALAMTDFSFTTPVVLTPHLGEMNRLLHSHATEVSVDFLKQCSDYAMRKNAVVVLKGGPSFIISPAGKIWINTTGDPGMATAGSGDVLSGMIAALMAAGLPPLQSALAGVCIHGWAGEIASKELSPYFMLASDIIERFSSIFLLKKDG
ncbi:NAD(P)H-hydrate dehydratase [Estrella lausannensis]|uniref:Bifunctional NAD(P)H-hydrate repair enzyme n=1 Tax=Estrella lausannensis TaxID=483423 RepID=A0A0H5DQ64_9BACT|nr:NAD(P)H-hydrate dehydratase [Estrella lausannensis]CRX38776.1 Carbohydrate kinase [Estrella lausannensis]